MAINHDCRLSPCAVQPASQFAAGSGSKLETTLANALQVLPNLPAHTHEAVLNVVQPAFVRGMSAATLVGAAITLALAWFVPRWLRRATANEQRK